MMIRRTLTTLVIVLVFVVKVAYAGTAGIMVSDGEITELDWSSIVVFATFESGTTTMSTSNDCYTATDNTFAAGGSPAINTNSEKYGSYGSEYTTNGEYYQLDIGSDFPYTKGCFGTWIKSVSTTRTDNVVFIRYDDSNQSDVFLYLRIQSDGDVRIYYDSTPSGSPNCTGDDDPNWSFDDGSYHFVQGCWDLTQASSDFVKVWIDGSLHCSFTTGSASTPPAGSWLRFGHMSNTITDDFHIDGVIVSSDETIDFWTSGHAAALAGPASCRP